MFKGTNMRPYLKFGLMAAIIYCIPVVIFLSNIAYQHAWLVYLGNLLFIIPIVAFLIDFNNKRKKNAGSIVMLAAGHITTAAGILISCVLSLILLMIFVPSFLQPGGGAEVLENAPTTAGSTQSDSLAFMIISNAIIGNLSAGSFVSIVFPFALKSDQTKEKVPRKQAEL